MVILGVVERSGIFDSRRTKISKNKKGRTMTEKSNNQVTICGEIASNGVLAYEKDGEKFYEVSVKTKQSEQPLPVIISQKLFASVENCKGLKIGIHGELHSYAKRVAGGRLRMILKVFANEIYDGKDDVNRFSVFGYICKPPFLQKQENGQVNVSVLLSVERDRNISDYVFFSVGEELVEKLETLVVSDVLIADGFLQASSYKEQLSAMETCDKRKCELVVTRVEKRDEEL